MCVSRSIIVTTIFFSIVAGLFLTGCTHVDIPLGPSLEGSRDPLGTSRPSMIFRLSVYDDKLIAAGEFSTACGVGAHGIAAWTPQ
jgi:hypothetical protein